MIARPLCNVKKTNQGPCSVRSQAGMYEINKLTNSFLLLPNHKIKIAGQLAVGICALDCKYTFSSFLKKLSALTTGMEGGLEDANKMGYIYI